MSETQVLAPTLMSEIQKINESNEPEVQLITTTTKTTEMITIDDEDLEDGEIDDDDDENDSNDVIAVDVIQNASNDTIKTKVKPITTANCSDASNIKDKLTSNVKNVVTIDISDDPSPIKSQSTKSKKPKPLEDDHLSSIEHALANALKKKGIEPIAPTLQTHVIDDYVDDKQNGQQGGSRSSRRRKRKKTKQREEKEKSKSRSEKKKSRYDSPEPSQKPTDIVELDDDVDDYEMMNVRGGSPPPVSNLPVVPSMLPPNYGDQQQQSEYESDYSYESYESANDGDSPRNDSRRRRRDRKKDKKRRDRGSRNEKSHRRRDSPERQEPRKMELCKFYLLECCAKRDKCSYMHGDFPCKYYYLGMECNEKDDCKFLHGEPLTEQLRNILIKHLEMAPKEILGNFKRLPRDQAIAMITKRHEELCKKFKVESTWSNLNNVSTSNFQRAGGNKQQQQQQKQHKQNNNNNKQQQHQQHQHQQQQQQQQQHVSKIPSLLDMVIKPPSELEHFDSGNCTPPHDNSNNNNNNNNSRQQRKSRWNEAVAASTTSSASSTQNANELKNSNSSLAAAAAVVGPSYLDLKNLNGILSDEHTAALSSLGITNLEQVNQLTVGQLNQIGLTVAEINDIQLKAKNMANLGSANVMQAASAAAAEQTAKNSPKTEISSTQLSRNSPPTSLDKNNKVQQPPDTEMFCSNSNSNSNSAVLMVDYTQYLKDSHLPYDRNDDDERDDEQLVIDDGNAENDENPFGASPSKTEMKRKDSQSDSEQQQQSFPSSTLQMSDFASMLKNPFSNLANPFNKITQDPRLSSKQQQQQPSTTPRAYGVVADTDSDDERYFASRGRRSRSTTPPPRSGSSTPEASQSPRLEEFGAAATAAVFKPKVRENPKYERATMYDFDVKRAAAEDEAKSSTIKGDKDMRFGGSGAASGIGGDIDLRLPFMPVTNYTPATEIDASITSHLPISYKVYLVDIKEPSYAELRQNFKSDQTSDPRLRRILGLPETSQSRTAAAVLSRNTRKLSHTIASPESSDGASPKYYTPPMSAAAADDAMSRSKQQQQNAAPSTTTQHLRLDPRRAARQAVEVSTTTKSPTVAGESATASSAPTPANNAVKQNIEIRNHLQKSEWYKNLNSKFKIMVNQQLALVSTELKKFHQDPSPHKIFDISFIVNNATLQQILTQLGIYIDDNGEVAHIEADDDDMQQQQQQKSDNNATPSTSLPTNANILLPNLSQPPPIQQQQQQQQQQAALDFLRGPPPNVLTNQGGVNLPAQFSAPPPNVRPSLLGMPPVVAQRNPFNPFAQNMPAMNPFANAPSLLGPGPVVMPQNVNFNNPFNNPMNMPPQQQQRNFGNNNQKRNQRNQRQRNNNNNNHGLDGSNQ